MEKINHINIRVYGIILNEKNEILLSDEYVLDRYMTKFPGGGLIPGEGIEDCLKREAIEEFGQEIEIISHYYTTGFFQKALFYEDHQLISIYYKIRFKELPEFKISTNAFDFENGKNGSQSFRWASIKNINSDELNFPVDRFVLGMLKQDING
jgi:ADP-ribose pyrophosphatase YjhB (NUDIX family)